MQVEAGVLGQPCLDVVVFVGGIVVHDQIDPKETARGFSAHLLDG